MFAVKSHSRVYNKLYFLYILNVLDWICTIFLLRTGLFFEANPVANLFIGNYFWGFLIKCLLPLLITMFIAAQLYWLPQNYLKITNVLVNFGLLIYIMINLSHVINFVIYFLYI